MSVNKTHGGHSLRIAFGIVLIIILNIGLIGTAYATIEFEGAPYWVSSEGEWTNDLAFGDVDDDGNVDLAAGNNGKNSLYMNLGGDFENIPSWKSDDSGYTTSVALGDFDNDGDLDLAAAGWNGVYIYLNNGGRLETSPIKIKDGSWDDIAFGDVDNDGDL